ncbi:MAG: hypothetical protein AB2692_18725, partial [Candidatus Thiodiazotropha sp.]
NQWDILYHNWGIRSHFALNLSVYDWMGMYSLPKNLSKEEANKRLKRDIKWFLNSLKKTEKTSIQTEYWSYYHPTKKEMAEAQQNLSRLCHQAHQDHPLNPEFRSVPETVEK